MWLKKNYENIEELKEHYRTLAKQVHPDLGGSVRDMQALNNEYEDRVKNFNVKPWDHYNFNHYNYKEARADVINKIIAENELRRVVQKMGLNHDYRIECECVSGMLRFRIRNGYEIKELLKASGWTFGGLTKSWVKSVFKGSDWQSKLFQKHYKFNQKKKRKRYFRRRRK